jgi:hypothetical protein
MSKSDSGTGFNKTQGNKLVGPHGAPLPSRITWKQRWNAVSRRARVASISVVGVIAAAATLLTNLQTIQKYFTPPSTKPKVPPIVVEITNSSKDAVVVAARGDFFLWLPGPDAHYVLGKFEFHTLKDEPIESMMFTVEPAARIRLLVHIMSQDLYGRVLEKADCDIAFMIRKTGGGLRTTDNLPFTKEAISKYSTTVDIGTE